MNENLQIGSLIEKLVLLFHPLSKASLSSDAEKVLKTNDLYVILDFEAETLIAQCGLTNNALAMLTPTNIYYASITSDGKHEYAGVNKCVFTRCMVCAKRVQLLPIVNKHYTYKSYGVILHESKEIYKFKYLRSFCSEQCMQKLTQSQQTSPQVLEHSPTLMLTEIKQEKEEETEKKEVKNCEKSDLLVNDNATISTTATETSTTTAKTTPTATTSTETVTTTTSTETVTTTTSTTTIETTPTTTTTTSFTTAETTPTLQIKTKEDFENELEEEDFDFDLNDLKTILKLQKILQTKKK